MAQHKRLDIRSVLLYTLTHELEIVRKKTMSEFFQRFFVALIFTSLYFGINAWECGKEKKKLRNRIEELENELAH